MGQKISKPCEICEQPSQKLQQCISCKKLVCVKCYDYPIIKQFKGQFDVSAIKYDSACKTCFKQKIELDLTKNLQIIGEVGEKEIIFLHGAGSTRKMFMSHAIKLNEKGFRCILIDLPGHGARMDEALTIQNCISAIKQAKNACKGKDLTIIGGSLGGYILMEALGKQKGMCNRAVIMMAGQNVGVNRGMKASIGLWAMGKAFNFMSQATVAEKFMQEAGRNKHLDKETVGSLAKSGTFFKHSDENIALLKQCNPLESLGKAKGEIRCLFINGSKDHRDSEQIWLEAAGKDSKLLVYEGADHFFSHDNRFFDRVIEDISSFIEGK